MLRQLRFQKYEEPERSGGAGASGASEQLRQQVESSLPVAETPVISAKELEQTLLPARPVNDDSEEDLISPEHKHSTTKEMLGQLLGHIKDIGGLISSAQGIISCALNRTNGKLLALPDANDVRTRVLTNMSRTYLTALTSGYLVAASASQLVSKVFDNSLLTTVTVIFCDYAACTAALSGLWILGNRKFFFDQEKEKDSPVTNGAKRREHFYSLLKADLAVSACIYIGTSAITFGLKLLAHKFPALSFVNNVEGIINSTLIYSCFLGIAAKNVLNFAKGSYNEFIRFWNKNKPPFPEQFFDEEVGKLAEKITSFQENPTKRGRRVIEGDMREILRGLFMHRNGKNKLD